MNLKRNFTYPSRLLLLPLALAPWTAQAAEDIGSIMNRINGFVNPTLLTLTAVFFTVGLVMS